MSLSKKQLAFMESLPSDEDDGVELTDEQMEKAHFCPQCGGKKMHSTDNMAPYPECYIKTFCSNCGFLIALVDNSPTMVWAEFKHNNWVIDL